MVVGFMFNKNETDVLLIEKQKPLWQKGKLNGIGGKVEKGETFEKAMAREFEEETGIKHQDWKPVVMMFGDDWEVMVFTAKSDDVFYYKQTEAEKVLLIPIRELDAYAHVSNLQWLIPMCLDTNDGKGRIDYCLANFPTLQEKDTIIQQLREEVERLKEEKKEWNEKQRLNNTMQQQLTAAQSLKWVKHLGQKVSFGFEGRKREGIIEGFDPRYGILVFDLKSAMVPYHHVREDLIDWPASESSPSTTPERHSPISDEEIERMAEQHPIIKQWGDCAEAADMKRIYASAYKSALQSISPDNKR